MNSRQCLIPALLLAAFAARAELRVGVDANYSLDMEKAGTTWRWDGATNELFTGIAKHGVTDFRVRLWTKDDGPHGKAYATEIVKRTRAAGLDPYLVIFLSEDWADMMKQPLPKAWQGLSFEERKAAVRTYSQDIVTHFRKEGLTSHFYEIGNEIDYGICGEYPGKSTKKNPESLSRQLWPRSAELIAASQAGVKAADPDAKFMLHIAHWWDADFCVAFFRFMLDHGAQVDFAGLSYFPSSDIGGSLEFDELGATVSRVAKAIGRPVVIPETAYPATRDFKGQFSRWKYEAPGYPLSPDGQRRWLADFLGYCARHPDIARVYYWSPEWCGEGMWKGMALFDPDGAARPAWSSFAPSARTARAPGSPVYAEAVSNRLFRVPVAEAKTQTIAKVRELRAQTGGVNLEHIKLLTNTPLRVGAYAVNLKGSLTQNLKLDRASDEGGLDLADPEAVARDFAAGLDPEKERVILFVRETPAAGLDRTVALLRAKGIDVVLHPRAADQPLLFGLGGLSGTGPE